MAILARNLSDLNYFVYHKSHRKSTVKTGILWRLLIFLLKDGGFSENSGNFVKNLNLQGKKRGCEKM